jgi:hypothetical protein
VANCVGVHDVAAAGEFHRDIQARASCRSFGLRGLSHNALQAKNIAACRVLEKPSERSFAVDAQIALSLSQSKFGALFHQVIATRSCRSWQCEAINAAVSLQPLLVNLLLLHAAGKLSCFNPSGS